MPTSNNYYIYIYLDPEKPGMYSYDDGACQFAYEPFYIGKGVNKRLYEHIAEAKRSNKNTHKLNRIRAILVNGGTPIVFKYMKKLSEPDAHAIEISLITKIGRRDLSTGPLTNMTSGGEGISGFVKTAEHIRKIKIANSGTNSSDYGKHWYNNGIREARFFKDKQPTNWLRGRVAFTESRIEKLSIISKGKLWYTNGTSYGRYNLDEQPTGWTRGTYPVKDKTKNKLSILLKGKPNLHIKGKKYYTNGLIEKFFFEDTQPIGWALGRLINGEKHHCTNKSPMNKGKKCYNNGITNKCFTQGEHPTSWVLGMLTKQKKTV